MCDLTDVSSKFIAAMTRTVTSSHSVLSKFVQLESFHLGSLFVLLYLYFVLSSAFYANKHVYFIVTS